MNKILSKDLQEGVIDPMAIRIQFVFGLCLLLMLLECQPIIIEFIYSMGLSKSIFKLALSPRLV